MAGYPPGSGYPPNSGYPYAPPNPNPYASAPPYGAPPSEKPPKEPKPQSQPYGQPQGYPQPPSAPYYAQPSAPYADKPPKDSYHGAGYPEKPPKDAYGSTGYGEKPPKDSYYGGSSGYGEKPPKDSYYGGGYGQQQPPPPGPYGGSGYGGPPVGPYGSPFAGLMPSVFPPGTDPNIVACFQAADRDGSGLIDDKELQQALSSYNQSFSLRTVHLLMYLFTSTNVRKIGPKEFTSVFYSLQSWRGIFEKFDRDRSGKIDSNELREALLSLGFSVSPAVLELLVSKFDKTGGKSRAIEYDNFIECCLTVKGLTDKFKEKDTMYSGSATFTYESFMLTVLPFLIA